MSVGEGWVRGEGWGGWRGGWGGVRVCRREDEDDDDDDEQTSRLDSRDGLRLCAEKSATADTARLLT